MAVKVFVDFDGTISTQDVGNAFFTTFGGESCTDAIAAYKAEQLSAKDLFRREVAAIGLLHLHEAKTFLRRQEIDRSFADFVAFCRSRGIELCIVSDGLDYYITTILSQHHLDDVRFFANRLEVVPERDGKARLAIAFPFDDAECTRCACCKRNIIVSTSADDDIIVYIGEGYSDRCPAQYADIVFAKDALQHFCQQKNISYFLYASFADVQSRLDELLLCRKLKPRREAAMLRRQVFLSES
jgi:2,3-diketo-5-methylthio-1-phosphopentane phosphatase